MPDKRASPLLFESVGKCLFAARDAGVDQQSDWLSPLAIQIDRLAAAFGHAQRRNVAIEQVQETGGGTAPAIAQIQNQRI